MINPFPGNLPPWSISTWNHAGGPVRLAGRGGWHTYCCRSLTYILLFTNRRTSKFNCQIKKRVCCKGHRPLSRFPPALVPSVHVRFRSSLSTSAVADCHSSRWSPKLRPFNCPR